MQSVADPTAAIHIYGCSDTCVVDNMVLHGYIEQKAI